MVRQARRGMATAGVLLALMLAACGLPRDPEGTEERVRRERVLRAGLIQYAPWASLHEGRPTGPEPEAVERLASELGARVVWTVAPESRLMEGLQEHTLDLVVGGISAKTSWAKQLGLGHTFLTSRLAVGSPPGQSVPESLQGASVAVAPGSVAGPLLEKEGARVQETGALHDAPGLRAAWDWQLEGWGYVPWKHALREEKWVWLVPPGENGWLMTVDRFVLKQAGTIREGLVARARDKAPGALPVEVPP